MTITYTTGDPICGSCGEYLHTGITHVCADEYTAAQTGWTCAGCKAFVSWAQFHECPIPVCVPTANPVGPIIPLLGWVCPVCGTGNNPAYAVCMKPGCPDMLFKDEDTEDEG